jgi:hypothetical protein
MAAPTPAASLKRRPRGARSPQRLLVLEALAAAAEAATPPPGWVKPEGLERAAGLDPDVAGGLEFLALLYNHLLGMEVRLYTAQRRLERLTDQVKKSSSEVKAGLDELAQRLAALEVLIKG